jgi:hypothetical protein
VVTAPLPLRCDSGSLPCRPLLLLAMLPRYLCTRPCMEIHKQLGGGGPRSRAAEFETAASRSGDAAAAARDKTNVRTPRIRSHTLSPRLGIGTGDSWRAFPLFAETNNSLRPSEVSGMRRKEESKMPKQGTESESLPPASPNSPTCEGVLDLPRCVAGPRDSDTLGGILWKIKEDAVYAGYGHSQCLLFSHQCVVTDCQRIARG